jgi:hypothetical protein
LPKKNEQSPVGNREALALHLGRWIGAGIPELHFLHNAVILCLLHEGTVFSRRMKGIAVVIKLLKFIIGIIVFLIVICIVGAAYETWNNGPWYTYRNAAGERLIIGQNVRTTYDVYDEQGNRIDTVPGWAFEGAAPNSLIKNSKGELRFKDPQLLPQWMEITNAVLQPFLAAGHFVVDHVMELFGKIT